METINKREAWNKGKLAFWHHPVRALSATTGDRRCFLKPAGQTSAGRAGSSSPLRWSRRGKSIRLYRPRAPPTTVNICLQQPI